MIANIRNFRSSNAIIRCYHDDSRFSRKANRNVVQLVNKDARKLLKQRQERQDLQKQSENVYPKKVFEPFPFQVTEDNKIQTVKGNLCPLHDVPYEDQLSAKSQACKRGLRLLTQQLYRAGTAIRQDVSRLPCRFKPIIACSETEAYRVKDEFSIWRGLDGETETVGSLAFPLSRHGDSIAIEPHGVITIKPEVLKANELLNEFIRHEKLLPVCYSLGQEGGWRRFGIRINHLNQLMLIGILNPTTYRIQQIFDEKDNFRDFIVSRSKEVGLNLTSLFVQASPNQKSTHEKAPFELLHGDPSLEYKIGQLRVMMTPESYLPDNLESHELLCNEVRNTIIECFEFPKGNKPIIIDAMCKSGLLAVNLADLASLVVGVDNVRQSIDTAINITKINQVDNCQFIYSSLEVILERLLAKYTKKGDEIVLVAHVGKTGLLPYVAEAIRNCESIKRIIYVTPKIEHQNCQNDLMRLCQKQSGNTRATPPFIPIQATPVDILPHCEGCNLILALQRVE